MTAPLSESTPVFLANVVARSAQWTVRSARSSARAIWSAFGARRRLRSLLPPSRPERTVAARAPRVLFRKPASTHPLRLAAAWDLIGAGSAAGLPLTALLRMAAAEIDDIPAPDGTNRTELAAHGTDRSASTALRRVADLLEFGADPVSAWAPALGHPETADFARAARRTARTGSGLAPTAADLAARERSELAERSQAHAQRASVWVTAPLGLCFLPAFLCLGVVPVVLGMVRNLGSVF